MSDFNPKYLSESQVKSVFDAYLENLEVSQLREHIRLLVTDHAPEGQVELGDSHTLVAKVEAERDRLVTLVSLVRKGKA
jgi:hypothetical protein